MHVRYSFAPVANRDRSSESVRGLVACLTRPVRPQRNDEDEAQTSLSALLLDPVPEKRRKKKKEVRINIKLEEENKLYSLGEAGELH